MKQIARIVVRLTADMDVGVKAFKDRFVGIFKTIIPRPFVALQTTTLTHVKNQYKSLLVLKRFISHFGVLLVRFR